MITPSHVTLTVDDPDSGSSHEFAVRYWPGASEDSASIAIFNPTDQQETDDDSSFIYLTIEEAETMYKMLGDAISAVARNTPAKSKK